MSAGKKLGGYTSVTFCATVGFSTTVTITGLWNGTQIGEGVSLTQEDAGGKIVNTGNRQTGTIRTTAITAAFISTLIETYMKPCADVFFRYYYIGGGYIQVNEARIQEINFSGSAAGDVHLWTITHTSFDDDPQDMITVT